MLKVMPVETYRKVELFTFQCRLIQTYCVPINSSVSRLSTAYVPLFLAEVGSMGYDDNICEYAVSANMDLLFYCLIRVVSFVY